MSVRLDSTTDVLSRTLGSALTVGTGSISVGLWVKLKSDVNARRWLFGVSDVDPSANDWVGAEVDATGTLARGQNSGVTTSGTTLTVDTWYWLVMIRQASEADFYVYDDSASTTPVFSHTGSTDTTNYSTLDTVLVGGNPFGFGSGDFEAQLLKIATGLAWDSTARRAESQFFALQTGGYTEGLSYGLETTTADQYGLNEYGGNNNPLSNTGCVDGASRPSQLEAAGGSATTLYLLNSTASGSNFGSLQFGGTAPSTATTGTGWTVDTVGSGNYARMAYATERASSTFSGTAQPSGAPDNTLGDCWRSSSALSGDFATGVWTIAVPVIAVTAAAGQDGRVRVRLWRATSATGASATEITSGAVAGTTVTNLATGAEQLSTVTTASITGFTLANEYLFVQVAWEITGAAA